MIEVVRFRNFKALREVDVALGRFTVLAGPNACGKTSVLEGLLFLLEFARSLPPPKSPKLGHAALYTVPEARSRGAAPGDLTLEIAGPWQPGPSRVKFQALVSESELAAHAERAHEDSFAVEAWGPLQRRPGTPLLQAIRPQLPVPVMLRVDPARCAEASYSEDASPRVERDGYGVASVLADMLVSRSRDFDTLLEHLRRVVPSIREVRAKRAQVERQEQQIITVGEQRITSPVTRSLWGHAVEFDVAGAEHVGAQLASEGTLIVLALLTALFGEHKPKLLLLDDLERGLHPKAQAELVRCLRELLAARPDLQIVATSHSPDLLDQFDPSEVRLMAVDDEGRASCASLVEYPDFERRKGVMTPGQFWASVGEGWVKDAARAKHDASGALRSERGRRYLTEG
jgi:energy-coupling factor transporter ATP-binding protein EcfA2